jgi:hypothetical protein
MNLYRIPTCAARDRGREAATNWYTYVRAESPEAAREKMRRFHPGAAFGKPEPVDAAEPGAVVE